MAKTRDFLGELVAVCLLQPLVDINQQVVERFLQFLALVGRLRAQKPLLKIGKQTIVAQDDAENRARYGPVMVCLAEDENVEEQRCG